MVNKFIQFFTDKKYSIPLLLLLVCILSYGILIPTLGLYWDGWPYMWQYHVFGPNGFPQFVSSDRPHSAWIFMLITWLFGTRLIWYHLAVFLFHWLAACFIWWTLNLLWSKKWLSNAIAALFFVIYPGFLQQPISLPYTHHISHMALFFFSVWGMLFSLQNPRKFWWLTSICVLTSTVVNFSLEYFTPLEILRPIFIFIYLKRTDSRKTFSFWKVIKYWLPYLGGLLFFLSWRILVFKFPTYSPKLMDQFTSLSGTNSSVSLTILVQSFITVSVAAWSKVFHVPSISEFGTAATYLDVCLVGFSVLVIFFVLYLLEKKVRGEKKHQLVDQSNYVKQMILIGLLSIILPALMYWVLKLPILVDFAWDRLNLSFVFGVSILMTGLLELLQKVPWLKILIASSLISLAIGFHFQNGMSFKRDWESFQDFFWQLTWRAPDMEKGTVILTTNFPLRYYSDNSLTAPLNWTYDPENITAQLNYLFYFTDVRLKSQRLSSLDKNQPIEQPFRSFYFEGNTNNSLVIKYSPPGCLQVLDTEFANSGILPNLTQLEADGIQLSNLAQIEPDPQNPKRPPQEFFSKEPEHGWCYFFEKADLARQMKDWQTIVEFGMEAKKLSLQPRNPSEWLPFIEAYFRLGKVEDAKSLVDLSIQKNEKYLPGICYTWKRMQKDTQIDESIIGQILQMEAEYNCPN
jgi:hypothetical protein